MPSQVPDEHLSPGPVSPVLSLHKDIVLKMVTPLPPGTVCGVQLQNNPTCDIQHNICGAGAMIWPTLHKSNSIIVSNTVEDMIDWLV